jgi:hypothetical protein
MALGGSANALHLYTVRVNLEAAVTDQIYYGGCSGGQGSYYILWSTLHWITEAPNVTWLYSDYLRNPL